MGNNRIPIPLPSSTYMIAWHVLYRCFSEMLNQDGVNLMESVLSATISEEQKHLAMQKEEANATKQS